MQSLKQIKWKTKDYVETILLFAVNIFVLIGLCVLAMLLNSGDVSTFTKNISSEQGIVNISNIAIEMIILGAVVCIYFCFEYSDFLLKKKNVWMIFFIIDTVVIIYYVIGRYVSVYARPVALVALLGLYLIDRRSSTFLNIVMALTMFVVDMFTFANIDNEVVYCSLVLNFIGGIIGSYLLDGVTSRLKIFLAGLIISLPIVLCVAGVEFTGFRDGYNYKHLLFALISGVASTSIMIVVLPIYESAFNIVTNFRLAEITDVNAKLIKTLRENAPGTYNHALTVSLLAEACATAIGENVLKARAAAYYHDIGKLKQPEYYAENQSGYNPHDELLPELSADIIRSHAYIGSDIIEKNNLPEFLSDVAKQHHGTLPIKYFFAKAKKYTESEVDIRGFSYLGPKPTDKISAIIMICDASEARVRTLSDRSFEKMDKAVIEIIEERIELDQFTDCDITLRELDIIRMSIVNTLGGVYHSRIKYPKMRLKKESKAISDDNKNN